MGLHQFSFDEALAVLSGMKRVAQELIVLDYASPLPLDFNGFTTRFFEVLGRGAHNANFKNSLRNGGIASLGGSLSMEMTHETIASDGVFTIVRYQSTD